jgi:capsular exopolysaccharide synthesis family protein
MGLLHAQVPSATAHDFPPRQSFAQAAADTSLSDSLATLRKRKWVLILAAALGLALGLYRAYTQPKVFDASSTIQVRTGATNQYKLNADVDFSGDSQDKMNTEIQILKSQSLMIDVANHLNLANDPGFNQVSGPMRTHVSLDDPLVRQRVVSQLQGKLSVALIPKTEMIRIKYASLSPKLSMNIVNQVVKDYQDRTLETRLSSQSKISEHLQSTLDGLKNEVEESQEEMMELRRRLGESGFDSEHTETSTALEDLLRASGAAKIQRIQAESRYKMLATMDPSAIDVSVDNLPGTAPGELNLLRSQLAAAKANYAQLSSGGPGGGLGDNNPTMLALNGQIKELTRQIDTEQQRLQIQAKQTYLAAKANEDKTEQELEARKAEAYQQRDDMVLLTLRQREFEQKRTLYEGLEGRLQTAGVQAGLESMEVDVVDPALLPTFPTLQSKTSIVAATTVFFLLGGIVLVFLLESLDSGFDNISEIESVMELPSLAVIPRARRISADQTARMTVAQRNINVLTQPKSQFTESFRSLRTSLLLSTTGHPPKFILFTSATPSEGKTTTASNLACVLAQRDSRVLLIDADLRRPNVHHRFGLTGKVGLTTLLTGATTLEQSLQRVPDVPNLDILPSGPVPPFPTEMLSSEAMLALLERLGHLYTHVVIDSPPILSVTDGVILARIADAVVLVIRHGKSSKHVIRRARDLLLRAGARITGLVLNSVDLNSPEYYGYYGYSSYSYSSLDSDSWESQGSGSKKHPERVAK